MAAEQWREWSRKAKRAHEKGAREHKDLPRDIRKHFEPSNDGERAFVLKTAAEKLRKAQEAAAERDQRAIDALHEEALADEASRDAAAQSRRRTQRHQLFFWIAEITGTRSPAEAGTDARIDDAAWALIEHGNALVAEHQRLITALRLHRLAVADRTLAPIREQWIHAYDRGGTPGTGRGTKSRGLSREDYLREQGAQYRRAHPDLTTEALEVLQYALERSYAPRDGADQLGEEAVAEYTTRIDAVVHELRAIEATLRERTDSPSHHEEPPDMPGALTPRRSPWRRFLPW